MRKNQTVTHEMCAPLSRSVINILRIISPMIPLILGAVLASGCSVNKVIVNKFGDALSSGGSVYASDDDPELIKAAVPFSLKLMESLLSETPRHRGLLLAASSGFTQYAYAFVQQEADEAEEKDWDEACRLRSRARLLYLRARDFGLRGLEVNHQDFGKMLREKPKEAVHSVGRADVPLLYWTAASWAAAISLSKNDPDLVADLPFVEAMIDRAIELDEAFDAGAIHTFLISYEPARQGGAGDALMRSRRHFDRAMELSRGMQAGPLVALAETVSVGRQDRVEFESLLGRALAIDVDLKPEWRLTNLIMQRRARWLLSRTDRLFFSFSRSSD
jgi:predicted anti-sigma-YlaC factor YlaD